MTNLLREWLLGITCAAMIVALAEALAPAGAVKKVCKLAGGLLLILAVIQPLLKVDEETIDELFAQYSSDLTYYDDALVETNENLLDAIIAQESGAYISDKAIALGIPCQVTVETTADEMGNPIPYSITVKGEIAQEDWETLSQQITIDLGIPPERQYYERGET